MISRRNFVKNVSLASFNLPLIHSFIELNAQTEKPLTIGIIGAENSHTAGYGKIFNIDKKFPGVTLKYVWGEKDEFAQKSSKDGNIPVIVKDTKEMIGKIDALIVDHRHAKYHLEAARPFVEANIPTFIDKPFCYRSDEGKDFLMMAKQKGTPVTSYSTIAHSVMTMDMSEQVKNMHVIQAVCTGTADLDSEYGGIFFYGVHLIEPIMNIFGEDIHAVKVTRNGHQGNASLRFDSGLFATLIFRSKAYGWDTLIETDKGFLPLKSNIPDTDPALSERDMIAMFRTGKEPRTHQSILNGISVLEALEKSSKTETWTDVVYHKLGY